MSKPLLSLDNIELGALKEAANDALAEVGQDVMDRHFNTDERSITIKIKLKPDVQRFDNREMNMPTIDWSVEQKMPGRKGMTTRAFAEDGKLIINTGSPIGGNPNQQTIFDERNHD